MPRPLRIEYPNAWYHVTTRGANNQSIFCNSSHAATFLTLLNEITDVFGVEIHAYSMLPNHYHLLIRTPRANIARVMRHLNGSYTQKFNQEQNSHGTIFHSRYKSFLIDPDEYLLRVSRYIHLAAVDINMANNAEQYKWASMRAYTGKIIKPTWLHTETLLNLSLINESIPYSEYVARGNDKEMSRFYIKQKQASVLGSEYFKRTLTEKQSKAHNTYIPSINKIMHATANYFNVSISQLRQSQRRQKNIPRMAGMYLARNLGAHTLIDIAEAFTHICPQAVSTAIKRYKQRINESEALQNTTDELEGYIQKMDEDSFEAAKFEDDVCLL